MLFVPIVFNARVVIIIIAISVPFPFSSLAHHHHITHHTSHITYPHLCSDRKRKERAE
ncbi:hypothetical protein BofuT4_uP123490.1 [Botrytis cinerea T4]|uniref:Uncharacterized protein n=1 Tax=Botryotinia fuckeliana (strain T4) TaxID=999810 RepID=G2YNY2_BOTF4|nr:hypothetical protein BofuT4_uP123490.1 [Botrytis cinerea T4]